MSRSSVRIFTPAVLAVALAALLTGCGPTTSGTSEARPTTSEAAGNPASGGGGATEIECDDALRASEIDAISGRPGWRLTIDDSSMPDDDLSCEYELGIMGAFDWQHLGVYVWSGDTAERLLGTRLPGTAVQLGRSAGWDERRLLVELDGRKVLGVDTGGVLGDAVGVDAAIQIAKLVMPRL